MRKILILVITLILLLLFSIGGFSWWNKNSQPASSNSQPTRFVIPKGKSASQIGEMLYEDGLLRSPLAFKIYVQVSGNAVKIQSGEFTLSPNLTLAEVVDRLTSGPEELWVTVPEGLRREEIVEKFIAGLEMNSSQAAVFRQEFLAESEGEEGFLFPDTYLFPRDATASQVVGKLRSTFDAKTEPSQSDIGKSGYNLNEVITLASIIERETKGGDERPIVAGILYKRLKNGVALQADATVQYAVANVNCKLKIENCDDWWPVITRQDWEINSPYNTYKFSGLPSAPIANPGLSAIQAAVYPQDSDFWYYIHDTNGAIHFAKTLEEHNSNVRKYLGR